MKSFYICVVLILITNIYVPTFDQFHKTLFFSFTVEKNVTSSEDKEMNLIAPSWWLNIQACLRVGFCCCADGNMYYCDEASGTWATCVFGGAFECTPDLRDCLHNPSDHNCNCCPPSVPPCTV
jgi:hypothetical protein